MLGDCYAAAVVEELSKKELMALDAAVLYQDTPVTPNGHLPIPNGHNNHLADAQTDLDRQRSTIPDAVVVEINGRSSATPNLCNGNGIGNGNGNGVCIGMGRN